MEYNFTNLKAELLRAVASGMASFGFENKFKAQTIVKSAPFGRVALHLGFIKHKMDFDVTADIAIRFEALENLLWELGGSKSESEHYSLGAELGNIRGEGQKRWTICSSGDVEVAASSIVSTFETVGLPYSHQFQDLKSALEAFRGDDKNAWLHSPVHFERAKRALGLAFLLGDRNLFTELANAKTKFLTQRNEFGLQVFLDLKARLEDRFSTSSAR